MRRIPTVLDITKQSRDQKYEYRLSSPQPFIGPVQQVWDAVIPAGAISTLCSLIERAMTQLAEGRLHIDQSNGRISDAGTGLFDSFFPVNQHRMEDLRKGLKNIETALLIATNDAEIPWELLQHPAEEDCLALRYDVGRTLVARHVPIAPVQQRETRRCLLIANPNPDEPEWALPAASEEAGRLYEWFQKSRIQCDFLEGEFANLDDVIARLLAAKKEPYDIIHYAGHVIPIDPATALPLEDPNAYPREYAFRLHRGKLLTAKSVRAFVKPSPIVFLNACWSAKAQGAASSLQTVHGLTDAFLEAGALAILGSLFQAPDDGARAFAEKFYTLVFDGKSLGEAVRMARWHVRSKREYGATWACFVLYGNPCLQLELRRDELEQSLLDAPEDARLSRADFSEDSLQVVERAFEYGRKGRVINTFHLFAALVEGNNKSLSKRLSELNFPAERLGEAFQAVFKASDDIQENVTSSPVPEDKPIQFTAHTRTMLVNARKGKAGEKIAEADILRGFVSINGGSAGVILNGIGLDVKKLLHEDNRQRKESRIRVDKPGTHPEHEIPGQRGTGVAVTKIGVLTAKDCTDEAWRTLLVSVEYATRDRRPIIESRHLFSSMVRSPELAMATALGRYHLKFKVRGSLDTSLIGSLSGEAPCSTTVSDVLLQAQAEAARYEALVNDSHLVTAFVQSGGGLIGKELESRGVVLDAVISNILTAEGTINPSAFTSFINQAFDEALAYACKKRHPKIRRMHFLYGLLSVPGGLLAQRAQALPGGAQSLIAMIRTSMKPENASPLTAVTTRTTSAGLIRLLCYAEKQKAGEPIDEESLIDAFGEDGGIAGEFLIQNRL